jgi:hypothetical protein
MLILLLNISKQYQFILIRLKADKTNEEKE